jgi:Zn-finger nucleic acid-binding protein
MLQHLTLRILCPSCHISLAVADLEEASLDGCRCLICPECAAVLVNQAQAQVATPVPEPALHG